MQGRLLGEEGAFQGSELKRDWAKEKSDEGLINGSIQEIEDDGTSNRGYDEHLISGDAEEDGNEFSYPGQELSGKLPVMERKAQQWYMIPFSFYLVALIIYQGISASQKNSENENEKDSLLEELKNQKEKYTLLVVFLASQVLLHGKKEAIYFFYFSNIIGNIVVVNLYSTYDELKNFIILIFSQSASRMLILSIVFYVNRKDIQNFINMIEFGQKFTTKRGGILFVQIILQLLLFLILISFNISNSMSEKFQFNNTNSTSEINQSSNTNSTSEIIQSSNTNSLSEMIYQKIFTDAIEFPMIFFVGAFTQVFTSFCVAQWYFSRNPQNKDGILSIKKGLYFIFIKHFGSLVLLGFVKALLTLFKVLLYIFLFIVWIMYFIVFCLCCLISRDFCNSFKNLIIQSKDYILALEDDLQLHPACYIAIYGQGYFQAVKSSRESGKNKAINFIFQKKTGESALKMGVILASYFCFFTDLRFYESHYLINDQIIAEFIALMITFIDAQFIIPITMLHCCDAGMTANHEAMDDQEKKSAFETEKESKTDEETKTSEEHEISDEEIKAIFDSIFGKPIQRQ